MDSGVDLHNEPGNKVRWAANVPGPEELPPSERESSLITPFTRVPRMLADSAPGQVAWNMLLFAALPVGLFAYWAYVNFATEVGEQLQGMRVAVLSAGVWLLMGPMLMYWGEHAGARWIESVNVDSTFGWNIDRVRAWKRRIDRLYYPTALLGALAAAVAFVAAMPTAQEFTPLADNWFLTAFSFLVFSYCGFLAMSGLNGVIRWMVTVYAAVTDTELQWHPLRAAGRVNITRCYRTSLLFGVGLSSGALFVPLLLVIMTEVGQAVQIILWGFIGLLLLSGFLTFTIPVAILTSALSSSRRRFLESVDAPLADVLDSVIRRKATDGQEMEFLDRVLKIRRIVVLDRLFPVGHTIWQSLLTTVIPLASAAISVLPNLGL